MRRVYDLSLSVLAVAALWAAGASAQEVPCTAADGLRCTWGFPPALIQPAGLQFDLQARVSQAGLQVPDGTLPSVLVNVLRGREVVCQEALSNVPVRQSVLNLSVGAGASCKLDEVTAKSADLALQVCLGPGNCLKPLPVGSSPYAYNARYASIVQRARRANTASHARWTRWITADRSLWVRPELATGAFDLSTPEPNDARNLYGPDAFSAFANAGFFTWSPLADPNALHLHISGKGVRSDRLSSLDELVFLAHTAALTGALRVTPELTGQGLRVTLGDALVSGHTTLDGALLSAGAVTSAAGDLTITGGMDVVGDTRFGGGLSVATGLTAGGGWNLAGDLVITGALELDGNLVIGSGGAQIAEDAATGGVAIALDTDVGGDLVVHGTTTFKAFAQLEAGSSSVGAQADARYVSAGDTRAVTLGGVTTLAGAVTVGTGLNLASQEVAGLELPTAVGALPLCDAANQGAFVVNGPSVEFCIDGTWRRAVAAACGDGRVTGKETCDDKNKTAGDGCSDTCLVEVGYECLVAATPCTRQCGNGKVDGLGETCDDLNVVGGDGCDSLCHKEPSWACSGTPSICTFSPVCGDGHRADSPIVRDTVFGGNHTQATTFGTQRLPVCPGTNQPCASVYENNTAFVFTMNFGAQGGDALLLDMRDNNYSDDLWVIELRRTDPGDPLKPVGQLITWVDVPFQGGNGAPFQMRLRFGTTLTGVHNLTLFFHRQAHGALWLDRVRAVQQEGRFEECDDGNPSYGDGCGGTCYIDRRYRCSQGAGPSVCTPTNATCGDGQVPSYPPGPCDIWDPLMSPTNYYNYGDSFGVTNTGSFVATYNTIGAYWGWYAPNLLPYEQRTNALRLVLDGGTDFSGDLEIHLNSHSGPLLARTTIRPPRYTGGNWNPAFTAYVEVQLDVPILIAPNSGVNIYFKVASGSGSLVMHSVRRMGCNKLEECDDGQNAAPPNNGYNCTPWCERNPGYFCFDGINNAVYCRI